MEIKELFEHMKTATDEQNDKALEVFDQMLVGIKRAYPTEYRKYSMMLDEVYKAHDEAHLTKEEALEYVAHMKNKDGSVGPHWSLEQVKEYMAKRPEFDEIYLLDFYVAINMMYSDYYKPGRPVEVYAELAKDFIADKDAPADKVKRYMLAMEK